MATLTNRTIRSTYDQLIHLEDLQFQDGFGESTLSGSYELVGDQNITGSLHISGNMFLDGTASIQYIVASYESSSIIFSSGSTKFGDTLDDTHEFTGSITSTGSFFGMAVSGNFTGSGEGLYNIPSASNADRATSASTADLASTASHALASSNLNITPENSSAASHYLLFAQSNTGEAAVKTDSGLTYTPLTDTLTVTKVIGQLEGTATNAVTASLLLGSVENAINAQTASLAISTSVVTETSTSFAESGDGPFTGSFSSSLYSFLSGSFTGSSLGTFTGSLLGNVIGNVTGDLTGTASIADLATTASHTAGTSSIADLATTASQANNASTASFVEFGRGEFSGSFSGSFTGDGSLLTGSYTVANPGNNRILTSVDAVNGNAEANLSFDGSTLTVVGNINTGQGVTEIYLMNQNVRTSDNVSFLSITETSAERFKENIQSLESNPILNLRPVTFNWKETGASDIGLIAEEVNVHLPELVKKNEEGEVEGIKYSKLTSLLIDVVQKQQSQIKSLQGEIKWIKNRL
jgi:hypothetical protein